MWKVVIVMSLLGTIAAAVGGDAASGLLNHTLSMRRQKQAQGFEADMYQQRYQMTVRDLQAAGLNPMLAYTSGVGSAPSSSAAGASPGSAGSDAVAAYNATRLVSAQTALLKAQKAQAVVQTEKLSKEADIKGPKAVVMRAVEDVLKGFVGSSAQDVGSRVVKGAHLGPKSSNPGPIERFNRWRSRFDARYGGGNE